MYYKEQSKAIPSMWLIVDGSRKKNNGDVIVAWTHSEEVAERIVQGMGMVSAIHKRDVDIKENKHVKTEHHAC